MNESELLKRTKRFSLAVVKFVSSLPQTPVARTLGNQLLRSGTSVGANYRAACRGRSIAEFIAKLGIVEEEADESVFWLEMFIDSTICTTEGAKWLWREAGELTAIMAASRKTASRNNRKSEIANRKSTEGKMTP